MGKECLLAYDLGTTGIKTSLFSLEGKILASLSEEIPTDYPEPGWAEQRPSDWWQGLTRVTQSLLRQSKQDEPEIVGIGISGHMMGCLPVTDNGVPLHNSIIHSDSRSTMECQKIADNFGEDRVFRITGQRLDPHYPLSKLMWLRTHRPEAYGRARFFLQCKDYIVFRLTGKLGFTDFSDASLTALYDINSMNWSEELCDVALLDSSLLPEVVPSQTVLGKVSGKTSRETGLREGTPVVAGAGDGACATLGAGVTAPGDGYNYIGGTSWIAAMTGEPDFDPEKRLFCMGSVDYGVYCSLGTIQSAGSAIRWLADELCREEKRRSREEGVSEFELIDDLARTSPPGAGKLFFLPFMMGERSPIWDPRARGTFVGLTLKHRREDLVRAVFEGTSYALRSVLDVMVERKLPLENFKVIGGGARSDLWLEILTSVLDRSVNLSDLPAAATSVGAALLAGVGTGVYGTFEEASRMIATSGRREPNDKWTQVYETFYPYYRSLYPALKESYARLSELTPDGEGLES